MESKFESGLWVKTILNLGSEYLVARSNMWSIQIKTIQKFLQIHKKIKCHARSKAKAKTTTERTCWYNSYHTDARKKMDRHWAIRTNSRCVRCLEESDRVFFDTIKQYSEKKMEQLNSTELNSIFEIILQKYSIGQMIVGKLVWPQEEVRKGDISIALIIRWRILYLRALQGHSGNNLIDPALQDNVVIGNGILHYNYNIGCAFNFHSIINNGMIPGGQDLSRRQTVFFLPIDPRERS